MLWTPKNGMLHASLEAFFSKVELRVLPCFT
jgi:hypothetical protein